MVKFKVSGFLPVCLEAEGFRIFRMSPLLDSGFLGLCGSFRKNGVPYFGNEDPTI